MEKNNFQIISKYLAAENEETHWNLAQIQKPFTTQTIEMHKFLN
jgi:hypothetical protein